MGPVWERTPENGRPGEVPGGSLEGTGPGAVWESLPGGRGLGTDQEGALGDRGPGPGRERPLAVPSPALPV